MTLARGGGHGALMSASGLSMKRCCGGCAPGWIERQSRFQWIRRAREGWLIGGTRLRKRLTLRL